MNITAIHPKLQTKVDTSTNSGPREKWDPDGFSPRIHIPPRVLKRVPVNTRPIDQPQRICLDLPPRGWIVIPHPVVARGNPIHVEEVKDRFELSQGFRRLSAFRELLEETGDSRYARIPATLQARGAQLDHLYRRMVDENLVRRDISFAEMARLAMSYADCSGETVADCVGRLFACAGRQKRSYIRHFVQLLTAFGRDLRFPEAVPRAMGLSLVKRVDRTPRFAAQVRAPLAAQPTRDATLELTLLRGAVAGGGGKLPVLRSSARTTIKLNRPEGVAKCTASAGRFEVLLDHDFGAVEPRWLEAAARVFLDRLKD